MVAAIQAYYVAALPYMIPIALLLRSPAPVRGYGIAPPSGPRLGTMGLSPRAFRARVAE